MKIKSAYKSVQRVYNKIFPPPLVLTKEQKEIKQKCEDSFYEFVKYAWGGVSQEKYKDNWHIKALCDHLQTVFYGEIFKKLIVNMPPRMGKSIIISVLYPTWCWIKKPSTTFLFNSYSETLSERDAKLTRELVESNYIQALWGDKLYFKRGFRAAMNLVNICGGVRIATTVGGSNTGHGGDINIIDDPNNIANILSINERAKTNRWFQYTMPSRVKDPMTARWVLTQQRSHALDLTGFIKTNNPKGWVFLTLPMEYEEKNPCITSKLFNSEGKVWRDPRKKEGELLFPNHYNKEGLKELKAGFHNDAYVIAGQLQQRPAPLGGGVIKTSWLKKWEEKWEPEYLHILQSWDTALTKNDKSAYSACTTWGVFHHNGIFNIMLLSLFRDKLEYPDLRKMILRLSQNYNDTEFAYPINGRNPVDKVLIEAKASGYSLLQDLNRMQWSDDIILQPFDPVRDGKLGGRNGGDKEGRARLVTHLMESGQVWLPTELPECQILTEEAEIFMTACELFPSAESNDVIDTMSQAFIILSKSGQIYNKGDYQPVYDPCPVEKEMRYY